MAEEWKIYGPIKNIIVQGLKCCGYTTLVFTVHFESTPLEYFRSFRCESWNDGTNWVVQNVG